jgi:Spy/CpxP family protein refolding chaperone
MSKRTSLSIVLFVTALAAGATTACSGSTSGEAPSNSAAAAATKAPVAQNAHGPVKLLGEALGEVALRPEQRAEIEKLAADAEARHAPVAAARREVIELLATQIESGRIDRAAMQPKIDASIAAWDAACNGDRAALERLHVILDADQREQLVDAVEARLREHFQAQPWRARIQEWEADLKLTDAQKGTIRDALVAQRTSHGGSQFREGMHKGKRALESFKSDRFVLDEVAPRADLRARSRTTIDHVTAVAETVLPLLTPAQRTIAAEKLRAHVASSSSSTEMF